jgi:hypothetical protein
MLKDYKRVFNLISLDLFILWMCRSLRENENENGREHKNTLYIEENNNYGKFLGKKTIN